MQGIQKLRGQRATPTQFPLWQLYPLFFCAVFLSHLTLLRLPYFWDEGGYYIPAAWDFFRTGTLIPVTTVTNAHPPVPSILLAGWWHLTHFTPLATRTFVCMVSAAALLAVYRIGRTLLGTPAAVITTLLTALYPIWFAQSTLAHADIFAAAFTLWALSFYLEATGSGTEARVPHPSQLHRDGWDVDSPPAPQPGGPSFPVSSERVGYSRERTALLLTATLFSLAALSKETAIVLPLTLALWESILLIRSSDRRATHAKWFAACAAPTLPLLAWYAYHYHRTGYVFGNPEYLRYNATANLDPHRIALCLYHRALHLTMHMNLFVPVLCTAAILFTPAIPGRRVLSRPALNAIAVLLFANWLAFSVLGGALLTRYLLPMYPLVLLVCVGEWQRRLAPSRALALATLSTAAFLAGLWIDPPYAFAPEDNLTYRDMIVLHQRAIGLIAKKYPQATVLTAWPATAELERAEIGYTRTPIKATPIDNFSLAQIQKAAANPGAYDTALIFSTKWAPAPGHFDLTRLFHHQAANSADASADPNLNPDARYFDFHEDVPPAEAAALLHGQLVYQAHLRGEWVAVLRFPRIENARLQDLPRH